MIGGAFPAPAPLGAGRYGYTPALLPKWTKALANVRDNAADARVLWLGDSMTAGIGCTNYAINPSLGAPPTRMAGVLAGLGVPSSIGLACPIASGDNRWTLGAGWSVTTLGFGSLAAATSPASAFTLTFADSRVNADTFDIYCLTNTGLGTVSAVATGGGTGTLNTSFGGGGVAKLTVTAAAAGTGNSVVITPTIATCYIVGVEARLAGTKKVIVGNAGIGTTATTQHVLQPTTFGTIPCLQAYAPDLTIIQLGANDRFASVPIGVYQANILQLMAAARVSGDVLLTSSMPGGSAPYNVNEAGYNAVLANAGAAYYDFAGRCGTFASYSARGMTFDFIHPGELGYWDWAQGLAAGLVLV